MKKKRVLSILVDENVSFVTKLELLVSNRYLLDYEGLIINIKSGGLYDDYNFEDILILNILHYIQIHQIYLVFACQYYLSSIFVYLLLFLEIFLLE